MQLSPSIVGSRVPEHDALVERGRLRFFAKATGQTDPLYTDLDAAEAAGHRDLPVPPTFFFCLDMDRPNPSGFYTELGIDPRSLLHGEEEFTYHAMAYAGDTLHFRTTVTDVYAKKGGALQFLVRTTEVTRDGEPIATLTNNVVIRQLPGASA
ncbi:MaoC family dehydratase N-terminal domain-containing protein [Streptomyces albipurpureus]|uniref:MaoC family dehydratase N-terminal domain-containing protein n=1 Tax=Streptomyces albipurpureus TaxID=2897419 RepID=A0ABT0UHT5_9ACTN|nr:MaoC family dehydratase N-terminal domain-containing protein [Streptomyces sp. CWNU-1]MCM2387594.1 MaoC family dehydratase N-terminal domain-containing protein [Streptomyces sp. CWNU-1]